MLNESQQPPGVPLGRYRHFKGKEYTVLGTARHSETLEELVVYRQEYGERGLWVRPKEMFTQTTTVNGQVVPRFQHLAPTVATEQAAHGNLLVSVPHHLPEEVVSTLLTSASVRVERIVSHGHASPPGFWYDQRENEWVVVLRGTAALRFMDDRLVEMHAGDFINIPAHIKHRVEWTTAEEPTVWLAVFYE